MSAIAILGNRSPTPPLKLVIIFKLQENSDHETRLQQIRATT